MTISCEPPPADPMAPPQGEAIASRTATIEVVPPSLPDLTVTAGSPVDVTLPCDVPETSYGSYAISWPDEGRRDGTAVLSVAGAYPPAPSPSADDTVRLAVPSDVTPGIHAAEARCAVSEGGTSAYYRLTVTVVGPGSAPHAEPIPAGSRYTG